MTEEFLCVGCGLCCTRLSTALKNQADLPWAKAAVDSFPYKARPDGSCEMLDGNRCSVYDNRPLLCNLERAAEELDMPYTKQEWFDMNYIGCASLMSEAEEAA